MGICRCNRVGKRKIVPIDQSTQLTPIYPFTAIIPGRSFFLPEYPSYPSHGAKDRSSGSDSQIGAGRGSRLVHSFLTEFEVVPVYRRFGAVVRRKFVPCAPGGQDVQDAVEQAAGGHIGVDRCAASLAGGSYGRSPRVHRQFPGRP
jgi:hypothetical protein